jgi:hypothetical protein
MSRGSVYETTYAISSLYVPCRCETVVLTVHNLFRSLITIATLCLLVLAVPITQERAAEACINVIVSQHESTPLIIS